MSPSHETKKAMEREAIHAFRRVYQAFPDGNLLESEEPDFLVDQGRTIIGIEVTEYFRSERINGSRIQEQDSLRHRIANRATTACAAQAYPIFATVFFNSAERITKRDVNPTADAIVRFIYSCGLEIDETRRVVNEGQLPRFVDTLLIYRFRGMKAAAVTTTDAVFVPKIKQNELQQIASFKEDKVKNYREKCTDVWLLIVVNGFRLSSIASLPTTPQRVISSFDRIFLLQDARATLEVETSAG